MISRTDTFDGSLSSEGPALEARTWTVAKLLSWTEKYFDRLGMASPRLDAELLLAHALSCVRIDLYTGYEQLVEEQERVLFRGFVARRASFEPVAYILGKREFFSLDFDVGPKVFIPRPETETLVDRVLAVLREKEAGGESPRILDLGTGSGCIAVSLAHELRNAQVTAVDISPDALELARKNAVRHDVADRIRFLTGDLFEPLQREGTSERFDVIVSNPPYVSPLEYEGLMRDVRDFEPELALLDRRDHDGLGYYRLIAQGARECLRDGALLAFELGESQSTAVEAFLSQAGWAQIEVVPDYAGISRVITAFRRV